MGLVLLAILGIWVVGGVAADLLDGGRAKPDELTIEELVARIDASGDACLPVGPALNGAGGAISPSENDDFEFVQCSTSAAQRFALVAYDPDHPPRSVPCMRAEGYINGQGAWWIHQEGQRNGAGGLEDAPPKDPDALRAFAVRLGGSFVDDC